MEKIIDERTEALHKNIDKAKKGEFIEYTPGMFDPTKFEKYFWLPLHWYFLNPLFIHPFNWLRGLPDRIKFRIVVGCPEVDTYSLDYTFYKFIYPRVKYTIHFRLKMFELDKETKKDYKEMLKLLEKLKNYDCHGCLKESQKFIDLFAKHLNRLGT